MSRRREEIVRLYMDGLKCSEIAEKLGTSKSAISVTVCRMRKDGVKLPFRNLPSGQDIEILNTIINGYQQ